MAQKTPKIIQLTTPCERFKGFDQKLDRVLKELDQLGVLYTDLGFREQDIEDLTGKEIEDFKDELKEHAQLIMSLLHHPLIQVLREKRDTAEVNTSTSAHFEIPTGVWQHYKGARYRMLGAAKSTDNRLDGVLYTLDTENETPIYHISLINFYRMINRDGQQIHRFTKLK